MTKKQTLNLKFIYGTLVITLAASCSPKAPNVEKYKIVRDSQQIEPTPSPSESPLTKAKVLLDTVLVNKKDSIQLPKLAETDYLLNSDELAILKKEGELELPCGDTLDDPLLILTIRDEALQLEKEEKIEAILTYEGHSKWKVHLDLQLIDEAIEPEWLEKNLVSARVYFGNKKQVLGKIIRLEDNAIHEQE